MYEKKILNCSYRANRMDSWNSPIETAITRCLAILDIATLCQCNFHAIYTGVA